MHESGRQLAASLEHWEVDGMLQTREGRGREHGQMAVELAVVMPVILIVLVIAVDMLVFAGECARFDHIAPQRVLAQAASAPMDGYELGARTAAIRAALESDFTKEGSSIEVSYEDAGVALASMSVYRCTFRFAPWPLSIAGAPALLEHECNIAVDPYTPGELL